MNLFKLSQSRHRDNTYIHKYPSKNNYNDQRGSPKPSETHGYRITIEYLPPQLQHWQKLINLGHGVLDENGEIIQDLLEKGRQIAKDSIPKNPQLLTSKATDSFDIKLGLKMKFATHYEDSRGKVCGMCEFKTKEEAYNAVERLHRMSILDKKLKVSMGCEDPNLLQKVRNFSKSQNHNQHQAMNRYTNKSNQQRQQYSNSGYSGGSEMFPREKGISVI